MEKNTARNEENNLDPSYQNGQSDAEKLMRRHLQQPGDVISDADLNNIEIKSSSVPPATTEINEGPKTDEHDDTTGFGPDRIITPLNVLGG